MAAFDDDVFAAGAPGVRPPRRPGDEPAAGAPGGPGQPGGPERQDTPETPPEDPEPQGDFAKGRRARTLTGIAAAAITTVLAVTVAGQVATGESGREDQAAGEADRADRQQAAPADEQDGGQDKAEPEGTASAAPRTYEQKMAAVYQVDPDLKGSGKFEAVSGRDRAPGGGRTVRYRVDVEEGIGLDGRLFADAVQKTLSDKRSWSNDNTRTFERVSSGEVDFVITLASPGTTGVWCAKSGLDTTVDNVSCDSAATPRIMINAYRWARGSKTFGNDRIHGYRQMLINHEVGHRLGFGHVVCAKNGALAPVMMQQTKTLKTGDKTCRPNAWPYPKA